MKMVVLAAVPILLGPPLMASYFSLMTWTFFSSLAAGEPLFTALAEQDWASAAPAALGLAAQGMASASRGAYQGVRMLTTQAYVHAGPALNGTLSVLGDSTPFFVVVNATVATVADLWVSGGDPSNHTSGPGDPPPASPQPPYRDGLAAEPLFSSPSEVPPPAFPSWTQWAVLIVQIFTLYKIWRVVARLVARVRRCRR